jgi:hypothetical protein
MTQPTPEEPPADLFADIPDDVPRGESSEPEFTGECA